MKKIALLLGSSLILSACANPQITPTTQNATKGILLCELGEICPVVKVNWNTQDKSQVQLDIYLDHPASYYDIKAIVFNNGQISYAYKPSSTNQEFRLGSYRSAVSIDTPLDLMTKLKGTTALSMNVITDKGEIKRYIYKDGKESSAYLQFVQAYSQ
ncbi:hypothetical protein [Acinetobacter rudis]|uniref:Lipoprotein n=1 Tax=Acinetobacter rudis TaxID=632955 RepID=A0AAW8J9V2_9GAMM|nr:hypothetical protein [Acinetobacter rudis]MDQ8935939.1 hypothetical protein [Acinetobacter rudis]MDQ8953616.1 hypothetical protein [Acinetobacter rudis]MDQ9018202.1 hypothetical protein [Acinetobacter rudis]